MSARVRTTLVAAATAAGLSLAPSLAVAQQQQQPPTPSPLPQLDGAAFPLAGGLAPTLSTFDAASSETALATRVVDGAVPQLVVTRVSPADGTRVGSDIVLSDVASAPAGADAAVAAIFQPAVGQTVPATGGGAPTPPPLATAAQTPAERGAWLVAWVARDDLGGVRVVGRRVAEDGTQLGGLLTLTETSYVAIGDVALSIPHPERRALVAWRGARASDAGRAQVVVQAWDPAVGRAAPFAQRISSETGEALGSLGVTFDARSGAGRQLVVWRGTDPERIGNVTEQEVLGRVLDGGGTPLAEVQRLSHVGSDGDTFARPRAAAVSGERQGSRAASWAVAWSQWPAGDAAVRLLDADAQGAPARTLGAGTYGESIEGVAVAGLGSGLGVAYDVRGGLSPRRVELAPLSADGTPSGAPLLLSSPGEDARLPLLSLTREECRRLALWRTGVGTTAASARFLREPDCATAAPPPREPGPVTPAPVPPARPTVPRARPVWGPLRLRAVRLSPRRIAPGRSATLRVRVTSPATVVVTLRRASKRAGGRRLPALRPAAATLRRVLVREPQTVVVRVGARDGRGRALLPGRYRLVIRATSPDRRAVRTTRVPLRIAGR